MNKMVSEIRAAIDRSGEKDSLAKMCGGLVAFLEEKGKEAGFDYFKTVLLDMSPYDWIEDVSPTFLAQDAVSRERMSELARLVDTLIAKQIEKRVPEETFYTELWERMWDDVVLPTREERAAFLQGLWGDPRIPYFKIEEGRVFQEDEFQKIVEKIHPALQKGEFIMNANIPTKSQRASLLLELAGELEDEDERIVFWGVLIGELRAKFHAALSALADKAAADDQ